MRPKNLLLILFCVPLSLLGSDACREDLDILTGMKEVPGKGRFIKDRSVTLTRIRKNDRGLAVSFLMDRIGEIGFAVRLQAWRRQLSGDAQKSAKNKLAEKLTGDWARVIEQSKDLSRLDREDLFQMGNHFKGMENNPVTSDDFLRFRNIIVDVPGRSHETKVFVGAHYDVVNSDGRWNEEVTEYKASPGANDNGTGVVAALELLRRFRANPPETDVTIGLLDGEEATPFADGLVGSQAYLHKHAPPDIAFILDMVGAKKTEQSEPFHLTAGYSALAPLRNLVAPFQSHFPVKVWNNGLFFFLPQTRGRFSRRESKHFFLGDRSSIEAETPYHSSRDTVELVDFNNLATAIDVSETIIRNASQLKRLEWNIDPDQ